MNILDIKESESFLSKLTLKQNGKGEGGLSPSVSTNDEQVVWWIYAVNVETTCSPFMVKGGCFFSQEITKRFQTHPRHSLKFLTAERESFMFIS